MRGIISQAGIMIYIYYNFWTFHYSLYEYRFKDLIFQSYLLWWDSKYHMNIYWQKNPGNLEVGGRTFVYIHHEPYVLENSLKIPRYQREAVNRRTNNTIANRRITKINNNLQNITYPKTKDWATKTTIEPGMHSCHIICFSIWLELSWTNFIFPQ